MNPLFRLAGRIRPSARTLMGEPPPGPDSQGAARPSAATQAVAVFLLLLTASRFWYAGTHELVQDEAYYWQWARHLDWGYYDNTPLVALVIRACITLLGSNPVGVRAGAILSALVAAAFIYLLARRLLGVPV
ncbi:MAG: hypothetical protein JO250_10140, partial [Armatimonadetes bacterium]|nr:hypothetical protein [Armatimonadota bacterium]